MPSSWAVYYVIFLSAALALGIPASLAMISFCVSPARRNRKTRGSARAEEPGGPGINPVVLGRRINTRFFLGINAALILVTLVLALVPCVGMLQAGFGKAAQLKSLAAIVTLASFALLGLLYSAKKGDLSWLKTFNPGQFPE